MHDLNVIDQFLQTFIRYIDSGFGLLNGNVAALTSILIAIDVTIAGLFWAMDGEANILGRLIKKILYVGAFAFIINNFSTLATIIYNSFAGLGPAGDRQHDDAAGPVAAGQAGGDRVSPRPGRCCRRRAIISASRPSSRTSSRSWFCSSPG